ncbi:MAG: choice-of-anchor B family protein [Phycisphaerae bacterium]|nr:choice-of-anchor B family protein [Phycisphaerae bacterium]
MATRRSAAEIVLAATVIASVCGSVRPALADDDDKKLLSKQPAFQGPVMRFPDAWKINEAAPRVPAPGDSTFPSKNVQLKSWIPLNNFAGFSAGDNGADCWGYTSPSGREYALMGLSWGNGIVEVTDPSNPVIVSVIPGGVNVLWRDITVIGQYAYAVSDSSGVGIQVIDLSQIDNGVATLVRNYSQGGHTTTHTLLENTQSGFLYACGGNIASGGFKPISLAADPTFPTFTGTNWTTSYVHEALIVSYTAGTYAGREIAFLFRGNSSGARMSIVDVTNKASLSTLASVTYPGQNYCHQGWLSIDRKYLYVNDEIDGPNQNVPRMLTRIFDVSDLSTPRLVSTFTNGLPAVDHNEYTKGRYLFQSNYTTGLRIWDVSNALKPVEVAFIDTRPQDDGTGYNGAWGNYPYFDSGTVLVSDIENGLFVVKLALLELAPVGSLPETLTPAQPTPVSVTVTERDATTQSVELMVSVNGGSYVSYPMTASGGGVYTGNLPATPCGARVNYYVQAFSNASPPDNGPFTWPVGAPAAGVITADSQSGSTTVFSDNFQTNQGWTVTTTATAGAWTRVTPLYNGGPGAVVGDGDGSGMCYVTGNTLNADVDNGSTILTSPVFNLAGQPEARITYRRWFFSSVGTTDTMRTEVTGDGTNWVLVSAIGPVSGGWERTSFRVADYVTPSSAVRVRFTVSDTDTSTTEGGIDGVTVWAPTCAVPCYANCDGSTSAPVLNVNDFTCFLNKFAAGDPGANCDGSSTPPVLNINDFTCFINAYAVGCP